VPRAAEVKRLAPPSRMRELGAMPSPRLFLDAPLAADARIPLDEGQARYLLSVMRLVDGAEVRVFNGADGEWSARLVAQGRKGAALDIAALSRAQVFGPDLTLLFAPVKRHGTDLIAEKATELGVRAMQPVITRRTVSETVRVDRLRAIATEAAEQTERLDIPEIADAVPLARALDGWDAERRLLFCDEEGDAPTLLDALSSSVKRSETGEVARAQARDGGGSAGAPIPGFAGTSPASGGTESLALLTGPEGGFDPEERRLLRSLDFVRPVSLGPRILRAETAVIAALALIQAAWGDS
jgi:16S rRNA (uracil1498-N3)-methyltransferase